MTDKVNLAGVAASLGLPCFPCNGDKKPITDRGFYSASSDPHAIASMFSHPNATMIGMPTGAASGLIAIDIDIKGGAQGGAWLRSRSHLLPSTRTHKTRSGGLHLIFLLPLDAEIRNSASRVAPGVDVRGTGGYIILPPSPGYAVADPTPPAEMPGWLIAACMKPDPPVIEHQPLPRTEPISDRYVSSAVDGETRAVAEAAEGGRNHQLNISAMKLGQLVGAGLLDRGTAEAELTRAAQAAGLDPIETRKTIASGMTFGMANPRKVPEREASTSSGPILKIGKGVRGPLDDEGDDPRQDQSDRDKAARKSRFATLSVSDVLNLPPPEWLITGILTCGSYAGIYGPPASLKSFTVLGMALAIAYGDPWAGREVKQMGVLYVAGEGARGIGKRIRAWQQHYGREGVEVPMRMLFGTVNLTTPEDTADLILATIEAAATEGQEIGLVVIDTVARAMVGADENSSTDMGRFNEACAEIVRAVPGAPNVLAVHHTGKDTERGARGSNSFLGAVDTMLRVTRDEGRLTLKVEKQKDDEDGFEIPLKVVGIKHPEAGPEDKPYSLVLVDASSDPEASKTRKAATLSPAAQLGLSALVAAVGQFGAARQGFQNVPSNVRSVTEDEWRRAFYSRSAAPTQPAKALAFKRAHETLAAKGVALLVDNHAWIVSE